MKWRNVRFFYENKRPSTAAEGSALREWLGVKRLVQKIKKTETFSLRPELSQQRTLFASHGRRRHTYLSAEFLPVRGIGSSSNIPEELATELVRRTALSLLFSVVCVPRMYGGHGLEKTKQAVLACTFPSFRRKTNAVPLCSSTSTRESSKVCGE